MSIYQFAAPSLVDKVTFHKSASGATYAHLHAAPGADTAKLLKLQSAMQDKEWLAVPVEVDGQPALEVRDFKDPNKLLTLLAKTGIIQNKGAFTQMPGDVISLKETIQKRSLFSSGFLYIVGDLKFFSYGFKNGSMLDMAAGVFYGLGTAASLLFGRRDPSDIQIQGLSRQIVQDAKKHYKELQNGAAVNRVAEDHSGRNFIEKTDDFLRHYPAEAMNTCFAMAGLCIATAAILHKVPAMPDMAAKTQRAWEMWFKLAKKNPKNIVRGNWPSDELRNIAYKELHREMKTSAWLDVGLGTMTMASGTFGNLVKEKKRDPDAPKRNGLPGIWDWVRERPLAVTGVGYMVSTMCHAGSTFIDWKNGRADARSAIIDRGLFVLTNLMAESLVAISSKGHGEGVVSDKSVDTTVISLTADMIARQPAQMQEGLIAHMSKFLGKPDVLAMNNTQVGDALRGQVESLRRNPWMGLTVSAAKPVPSQPSTAPTLPIPEVASWQGRQAARAATATPSLQTSA